MSYKNYVQPGLKLRPRTALERKIHSLLITLSLLGAQAILDQTSMLQRTVSVISSI